MSSQAARESRRGAAAVSVKKGGGKAKSRVRKYFVYSCSSCQPVSRSKSRGQGRMEDDESPRK